jgi:cell wall-associated NlpC family hydrolase/prophage tail gpP-like protein
MVPIFTGIADQVTFTNDDYLLSITGRDMSALATDSDAPAGRWRHVKPAKFIGQRAHQLGLTDQYITKMAEIGRLSTDASETEWSFWYRIVRTKGFFMWTGPLGALYIDHLNYNDAPKYMFGFPPPGKSTTGWTPVESVAVRSNKQGRKATVWVYGEDAKTGRPFYSSAIDPNIKSWKRKPLSIVTSTIAKSNADAQAEAKEEIFESIVGAFEIELTIHDTAQVIAQNRNARLNLPGDMAHLNGIYFVTGVTRIGGADGFRQIVRLRERGFAISKRVPQPPSKDVKDPADAKVPSSVAAALSGEAEWAQSFVNAAREFGVPAGWDLAVFLGTLLAICQIETAFRNVRYNGDWQWQPYDVFTEDARNLNVEREADLQIKYQGLFANAPNSPGNPYNFDGQGAAVGPMQLLSKTYKDWADTYGWNGVPDHGELEGGRWNPDSNIRAAARALVEKLNIPPKADPTNPDTIWIGVARYGGSQEYANNVRNEYNSRWKDVAESAVASATTLPAGLDTKIEWNGQTLNPGEHAPDTIKKALNFAFKRLGDPYVYGGAGPYYDCSSFVTAAFAAASPQLRNILSEPDGRNHGETTYSLFQAGRFPSVPKDALRVGDLVFFDHLDNQPQHVGIYIGDGLMVNDPAPGETVTISSINDEYHRDRYLGARRLVDWPDDPTHNPGTN